MILNDAGKIANECWLQIPEHFPDVFLHDHIVMPNHIHGIIELKNNPRTDANVLVIGENGTGKQLIVKEIHNNSRRADEAFISIDIGTGLEYPVKSLKIFLFHFIQQKKMVQA